MTIEESIKENGYAIVRSNLDEWKKDTFTAVRVSTVLFCLSGSMIFELNMIEYTVSKNSYISIPNDSLVKVISASEDYSDIQLQFSDDTALTATIGLNFDTMHKIYAFPYNKINDEREFEILMHMLSTLEVYATIPHYAHHTDFAYGLVRCIFIGLADISTTETQTKAQSTVYTSSDTYFMNFVIMLNKHCRQQHDVAFYADKLNITPKYLNEIARKKVNYTAKDIITKFVIAQLKRELMISGNSVQRIAYDFNFCDQSSLGKFFKKATGMSPVAFRRNSR